MLRGMLVTILVLSGGSLAYGAEDAESAASKTNCWITFDNKTGSALGAEAWSDDSKNVTIGEQDYKGAVGTRHKFTIEDGENITVKVSENYECKGSLQVTDVNNLTNVTYVYVDTQVYESKVNCYKSSDSDKLFPVKNRCECKRDTGRHHAKGTLVCSGE